MNEDRSLEFQPGFYDQLLEVNALGRDENLVDVVAVEYLQLFLAELPPNAKVLEAGSGAGVEAQVIEQSGKKAYLIDLSAKMLEKARQKTSMSEHVQADIFEHPFKDKTFDAVISKDVLSLGGIDERKKIIYELKRVLKPEGKLLIMVEEIPETRIVVDGNEIAGTLDELNELLVQGNVNLEGVNSIEIHQTQLKAMLTEVGFNEIFVKTITKPRAKWVGKRLAIAQATN